MGNYLLITQFSFIVEWRKSSIVNVKVDMLPENKEHDWRRSDLLENLMLNFLSLEDKMILSSIFKGGN